MPRISHLFFKSAILFLIAGIGIGLHMSIAHSYTVAGAHAHINLLGWVTSAIFGGYYALNPAKAVGRLPMLHFGVYTLGVVVMAVSLYLLLGGNTALEPVVAASSLVTFAGVLLFAVVVFMPAKAGAGARPGLMPAE